MNLVKYPVISQSGNIYRAEIELNKYNSLVAYVSLYKERKGLFRITKWEWVNGGRFDGFYELDVWDFNLKKMIEKQVELYEKNISEKIEDENKISKAIEDLARWDGSIT